MLLYATHASTEQSPNQHRRMNHRGLKAAASSLKLEKRGASNSLRSVILRNRACMRTVRSTGAPRASLSCESARFLNLLQGAKKSEISCARRALLSFAFIFELKHEVFKYDNNNHRTITVLDGGASYARQQPTISLPQNASPHAPRAPAHRRLRENHLSQAAPERTTSYAPSTTAHHR